MAKRRFIKHLRENEGIFISRSTTSLDIIIRKILSKSPPTVGFEFNQDGKPMIMVSPHLDSNLYVLSPVEGRFYVDAGVYLSVLAISEAKSSSIPIQFEIDVKYGAVPERYDIKSSLEQ